MAPKFHAIKARRPKSDWATQVRAAAVLRHGSDKTAHHAWVESALDSDWMVAYRIVPGQHREPVVAELRIFRREHIEGRPAGQWSADVLGIDAAAPGQGITADVIRRVSVSDHRRVGRQFAKWLDAVAPAVLSAQLRNQRRAPNEPKGKKAGEPESRAKPGRPPVHDEQFFAKLARDYAELVRFGSATPTKKLAEQRNLTPSRMRALLHDARERGMLSKAAKGRSGGGLTDSAAAMLAKK